MATVSGEGQESREDACLSDGETLRGLSLVFAPGNQDLGGLLKLSGGLRGEEGNTGIAHHIEVLGFRWDNYPTPAN